MLKFQRARESISKEVSWSGFLPNSEEVENGVVVDISSELLMVSQIFRIYLFKMLISIKYKISIHYTSAISDVYESVLMETHTDPMPNFNPRNVQISAIFMNFLL